MKIAICYHSYHHGNTLKVLEAMAQDAEVDLIDVTSRMAVRLDDYDVIGFASGIYAFKMDPLVTDYIRKYLPEGKKVFFVYTYSLKIGSGTKEPAMAAAEKGAQILGEFHCKGFNTFGPFKLVGGVAKGHPNADELREAAGFFRSLLQNL